MTNPGNTSKNSKNGHHRKIPIQILIFFLVLVVFGICIHCLITYLLANESSPGTHVTQSSTERIPITGSWQDTNLLNISGFQWVRNNVSICLAGRSKDTDLQEKLLLILVNSARENYIERSAIRKSIQKMAATIKGNTEWTVRLVFLLGDAFQPENSGEKDALLLEEAVLDEEHSIFGDLISGNFVDTFETLSYKSMMGLKWALTYCSDAHFIVKMDDDAFFNIPKFVEWRNSELRDNEDESKIANLYCIPETGQIPLRVATEKGYNQLKYLVSKSEWTGDAFPDYCNGLLYGMTGDLTRKVYEMSKTVGYFRIEDIFITGVVMNRVTDRYGMVIKRNFEFGQESDQTLRTICERKLMRQTVSQEIGLVVQLHRGSKMEKQMLCLAKNV